MKYAIIALSALCLVLLILIFNQSDKQKYIELGEKKVDTLIIEKPRKPLKIKAKAKIEKIGDSIIEREPFIASIDTIIERDTISATYQFPQDTIGIFLKRRPDTLAQRTVQIMVEKKRTWYETPAYIGIGAIIGAVVTILARK